MIRLADPPDMTLAAYCVLKQRHSNNNDSLLAVNYSDTATNLVLLIDLCKSSIFHGSVIFAIHLQQVV